MTRDSLIAQLAGLLGRRAAALEYRWMRDLARDSTHTLHSMVRRRLRHEPLQYILGSQPFGPLDLKVRAPVLIPRPETEDWTLQLSRLLSSSRPCQAPLNMLDLCTGTGCIPLLLSYLSPPGTVRALAVDISSDAVALARENAELVGVRISQGGNIPPQDGGSGSRNSISILQADILKDGFPETLKAVGWPSFDVLTANPPYIPLHEYNALPSCVKDHEDRRALLGDPDAEATSADGLTFYRRIAELVQDGVVKPDGVIALEVGHGQSEEVQQLMQERGHVRQTEVWKDPWGVPRSVVCWK